MKNKKKQTYNYCLIYGGNCKFCPRNKKCEEELKEERRYNYESKSNKKLSR